MEILPLLTLKDTVILPGLFTQIFVGREYSMRAIEAAKLYGDKEHILVVTQKDSTIESPDPKDLYQIGAVARIIQIIRLANNSLKILIEATNRVKTYAIKKNGDSTESSFLTAEYSMMPEEVNETNKKNEKALDDLKIQFIDFLKINQKINADIVNIITKNPNPTHIVNLIAVNLSLTTEVKQQILEMSNLAQRIEFLNEILNNEIQMFETEQTIQTKVRKQIEKTQRDYFLHEKIKAIQDELSDSSDNKSDISVLEKKIEQTKLSKEAREKAVGDLKKLKIMNPMGSEASVVRNYLDTLLALPWGTKSKSKVDIHKSQSILDHDHYGLTKVKDRIIEYIAVLQRSKTIKGPILCLVGPPGIGKTSLVKSIAKSLGRKYCKFSLGGLRDEAEIRGHRKTYLGSMPGKIITLIKRAKVDNPVILLDEIDKMSMDYRGDPASALLEVLDSEQNQNFTDHYLEVEYDISNTIFIATSNTLNMPRVLLDRMEVIQISGYIEDEKLQIATQYLIPKILATHSMQDKEMQVSEAALLDIIRYYTRESGVRNLEREISTLARKVLTKIMSNKEQKSITILVENLEEYLGVAKYRYQIAEKTDQIGATTGLAYTELGGELLTIESVTVPGKGEIKGTGKLGDVMQESAQAAYSYFRSNISKYGVDEKQSLKYDIHFHVPEGAVPKDGPSAGIAIFTTITSLMTGIAVKTSVAMTGEITLRGNVLAIGGLREKLLAASRGGIKTVIIPKDNERDLKEIPDNIKKHLTIISVSQAEEVLHHALAKPINSIQH